jgi:hypothetical protein
MNASVSDLLSAAGLLLGVVSVLYGLWFPEISSEMSRPVRVQKTDREPDYKHCRHVLFGRALPLAIASGLFALIFLPNAVLILAGTLRAIRANPVDALRSYDAVRASLVVVSLALITLAAYMSVTAIRLRHQCLRQDPNAG